MKELKVGERITLEAVEQYGCRGCFFEDNPVCIKFACCEGVRSDGKSVILKKLRSKAYEYKQLFTNRNGYDISKITGAIPQNIGEGFQFNLSGKTYTTMGSYTKDKKDS